MSKLNITVLILTVLIINKVQNGKSEEEEMARNVPGAGFEIECKIPSGPYRGGDEILFRTPKWEVHPDTVHRHAKESKTRSIHTEFATIGPLTHDEFILAARDCHHLLNNFNVYGYTQVFERGQRLIFAERDAHGKVIQEERNYQYNFAPEGIVVEKPFETTDTDLIHPAKDKNFTCTPQLTSAINKYHFHVSFDTYHTSYGDKKFQECLRGEFDNRKAGVGDETYVFLNTNASKIHHYFRDDSAVSLFSLTSYYFVRLFRLDKFNAKSLQLKYNIDILSRLAFSDMYDHLSDVAKVEFRAYLLALCSSLDEKGIHDNITRITLEHLANCAHYKLIDYVNEETEVKHPARGEERLTLAEWLFSVIDPSTRKEVSLLKGESVRNRKKRFTDLLSPPDGLRVMNARPCNNVYHYGMGKYELEDKEVFLVEFRSLGSMVNLKEIKNYENKMNEMYNFLYHNIGRSQKNVADIFQDDLKVKEVLII